jgi:hypothetical protein
VDEDAGVGQDAGPAVVVQITPRAYRARAVAFVVGGILLTAVSWWWAARHDRSPSDPLFGVVAVGYGVYCAVQARRQVTRTLLRIDRLGLRSPDGVHDRSWAGVVMVWVGSSTGWRLPFVSQPVISLYTSAGVDFARRAGTRPKPVVSLPVGPPWTVPALCDQLRAITGAPVLSGREVSRPAAARTLATSR